MSWDFVCLSMDFRKKESREGGKEGNRSRREEGKRKRRKEAIGRQSKAGFRVIFEAKEGRG